MAKTVAIAACETAQMNGRSVARIVTIVMAVVAALSFAGLISMMVASSGDYDEFGEMPIPGSALIDLPEGRIVVSFTVTASGGGTAVPPLTLSIEPPPGGRDPDVDGEAGRDGVLRRASRARLCPDEVGKGLPVQQTVTVLLPEVPGQPRFRESK